MKKVIFVLAMALSSYSVAQLQPETGSTQAVTDASTSAAATITLPDSVPQLRQLAGKAYGQKKYRAFLRIMQKLSQLRPLDTDYTYRLALAYALNGNKRSAYDQMVKLQRQGASYDFNQTPDSESIRGTEVYEYVNELMLRAGQPAGSIEAVVSLPVDVVLPEAIDWDPLNKVFLIGTVADGRILRMRESGETETLFQADKDNGMWSIYDIKVDARRKVFWVSSAAIPGYANYDARNYGRSALFKFDLGSGRLLQRYPMPLTGNPHFFANMALADDGSVYVADSQSPVLYVLRPGAQAPEILASIPGLLSIRSIVLNKPGTYLYISDYARGLFVYNLATGQVQPPKMPETLNTSGIDGMYRWENSLIVIQNGFRPSRVLRLDLDADGVEVKTMAPVAVAQPLFDDPSFGVVRGDWLYYFANSHWGKLDVNGKADKPVIIVRSRIDEANNLVSPDLDLFREQMRKRGLELQQKQNEAGDNDPG